MLTRQLVDCDTPKYDLVSGLFIVCSVVLAIDFYLMLLKLFYDLLYRVLEESLEWEDLLRYQTVLFKVAVDDFPAVILVDWVHVGSHGRIVLRIHFQPIRKK